MGKGDKKTKKGKRTIGSYGNTRPHKVATVIAPPKKKKKAKAKAKPKAKAKK